jgi:spermidine/putrescine transport system permease protein
MNERNTFRNSSISIVYIWLLLFAIVPLALLLVFSFLQHTPDQFYIWKFTWLNYQTLLSPIYLTIFWRSMVLAFWVTLWCLILGYPFAYFLTRLPERIKSFMALLVIIPFWTSSLLRTFAIITIIQAQGILNTLLLKLHIIHIPLQLLYTNTAVIIGLVYNLLPFVVLPLFANMEKMDRRLLDAARDLGANNATLFFRILLPLTRSGIFSAILLTFLPAMTLFYIPDLLGGAKSLLLGNLIEMQFLEARNWPLGAAVSIVLTLLMSILLWYYFATIPKSEREAL